jgi:glycosyltransferase involved in cell wall biosynthesis
MAKILYIGFGISPGTRGGAIVYQESLARGVCARGWETVLFMGVPEYKVSLSDRPYLSRRMKDGMKLIELRNSRNYPMHFNSVDSQCSDSVIENLLRQVLDEEKPDLVHFHELQMHTASLIGVVRERGIPCLKTMHNYYDICPQRDLMRLGIERCADFYSGKFCPACAAALPSRRVMPLWKKLIWILFPTLLYKPLAAVYAALRSAHRSVATARVIPAVPPTAFARRRGYFVEMLNKLDVVHCSSRRAAEIFSGCGVNKDKIEVIPISVDTLETIIPRPLRDDRYPIVFGYAGGSYAHKGFRVLIEAFSALDQTKAKLIMWETAPHPFEGIPAGLTIEYVRGYEPGDMNEAFSRIDIGVIPSVWEEMFGLIGLEWLSARIPVIGSDIGGIPQWLKDGENGFLFPPGDAKRLAQKMSLFVSNPGLVAQMQQKIPPQKTYQEHISEMAALYERMISKRPAG